MDVNGNMTVGGTLTATNVTGITSDMNLPDDVFFGLGTNNKMKLGFESGTGAFLMDADTTAVTSMIIEERAGGTAVFTFDTINGHFTATGDVTTNSDARLKDNVITVDNALSKVTDLRGVYFNKKTHPNDRKIGLIAQEVEAIIPEAVIEDSTEDKIKSVAYSSLVGLLIEAIKDLKDEVDSIKGQ